MSCSVMVLLGNYKSYLDFFNFHTITNGLTYDEHYSKFIDDCCAWNGAWVEPLKKEGFEVHEVFYNNTKLQDKWVEEFLSETKKLEPLEVVIEQISKLKPEVLFIDNTQLFDSVFIKRIRKSFPFVKRVLGYVGTNHFKNHALGSYDLVFCPVETYRKPISNLGVRAELLPHAFNSKVLDKVVKADSSRISKIMFAGGIVLGNDMHNDRLDYINHLILNVPMDILSDLANSTYMNELMVNLAKKSIHEVFGFLKRIGFTKGQLEHIPRVGHFAKWDNFHVKFIDREIKKACKAPKFGIELFKEIQKYTAVFNMHIAQVNEAANMRLYEVTGAGGCLLTDEKYNLSEIFLLDHEVVSYKSREECLEKAKWLIENPEKASMIGRAAQMRVAKDHTFFNRAENFKKQLQTVF